MMFLDLFSQVCLKITFGNSFVNGFNDLFSGIALGDSWISPEDYVVLYFLFVACLNKYEPLEHIKHDFKFSKTFEIGNIRYHGVHF